METNSPSRGFDGRVWKNICFKASQLARRNAIPGMALEDYEQDLVLDLVHRSRWFDSDRASFRTFADRVTVAAAPTFASNTPLFENAFNVPLAVQVRLGRGYSAGGEYVFRNRDLDGSVGQWSFAVEKSLWRHRFLVWIGNSPATTVDQMVAGDYAGGVTESNVRLGFNISRQFQIGGD